MRDTITRRTLVATAVAAGATLAAAPAAFAKEPNWADQYADQPENSWLGEAPSIAESEISQTLECEVLVVGAGTSGLFAACSAAEGGAKTLVIAGCCACGLARAPRPSSGTATCVRPPVAP